MSLPCKFSTLLLLLFFHCSTAFGFQAYSTPQSIIDKAIELQLHLNPGWQKLLHYRSSTLTGKFTSEVDDQKFFLAKDGQRNPKSELISTLKSFVTTANDKHPSICQFPARYYWLKNQLDIHSGFASEESCTDFNQWKKKMDAIGSSLIFPASYLDSPSSMFGHTLLRLDRPQQTDSSSLLSYTISYAAKKSDADSELAFVYRGLVGGYPGEISVLPYYLKLKEYSDIESRDIWEYQLNLTSKEIAQLVRHFWEIKDIRFNYYFFDENCSYRLLSFLNVVRPEQDLLKGFNTYAIPVDTVRQIIEKGWVSEITYRPSIVRKFNYNISQLESNHKHLVKSIITKGSTNSDGLKALEQNEKIRIFDVAYSYSRLAPIEQKKSAQLSYQLLLERQKFNLPSSLTVAPQPSERDDQGHLSGRWKIDYGELRKEPFIDIQWRPAYHDLTDPGLGYPLGSELKFLETEFRSFLNGKMQLQQLTLIGIKSIKPRTEFFSPVSWSVAIKAKREILSSHNLVPGVEGQIGYAYNAAGSGLLYSLVGGEILLDDDFKSGIDVLPKINLGLIWRNQFLQANLDYQIRASIESADFHEEKTEFKSVLNINHRWATHVSLQNFRNREESAKQLSLGLNYFYR